MSMYDEEKTEAYIEKLEEENAKLKNYIEKLKPFVDIYNETFGTKLVIGNDEFESTFIKYAIVPVGKIVQKQAIIDELIDTLHHEGIDTKQIIEEVKEKFPHYVK